jgi:hypothetical protein
MKEDPPPVVRAIRSGTSVAYGYHVFAQLRLGEVREGVDGSDGGD